MNQNTPSTKYKLHCFRCSFRKNILEEKDLDGLVEMKIAPIQGHIPQFQDNKTKTFNNITQNRKFKCPKCGFAITLAKNTYKEEAKDESKNQDKRYKGSSFRPTF